MKWHLTRVLICISLITSDAAEHLMCLLTVCIFLESVCSDSLPVFYNFSYLLLAVLGLRSAGCSLEAGVWAGLLSWPQPAGFSLRWLLLLPSTASSARASVAMAPGLWWAQAQCGWYTALAAPWRMGSSWTVIEPMSPALGCDSLPLSHKEVSAHF